MGKNDKKQKNKNYDLKSDAVEKLLDANSGKVPEYSREELEKYRSKKGFKIPDSVKVLFIKAWFAGAVCYFVLWGLGIYLSNMLDMLFVLGVVLGIVTDLLVNNIIRFIEKTPGQNDKWMMIPGKGVGGFFLNIPYSMAILFCVYTFYNVLNLIIVGITGAVDMVLLGVEPILFGVFCMGFDMLFIACKRLLVSVVRDAKAAAGGKPGK